eukprot:365333-Chlamydomonas_euryale.AAC.3
MTSKLKIDQESTLEEDAPKTKQIGSPTRGCNAKIGQEGVVRDDGGRHGAGEYAKCGKTLGALTKDDLASEKTCEAMP